MPGVQPLQTSETSRRRLIVEMAVFAGATLALGASLTPRRAAAAQAKLSQTEIGYQSRPNGVQRCDLCVNWRPPASCKVVGGSVSPSGWCSLFARNP